MSLVVLIKDALFDAITLHYFLIKKYMYIKQAQGGNSESAVVVFLLWLYASFSVNFDTTCTKSHYYAAAVFFMHFTAEGGCETLVTGSFNLTVGFHCHDTG